MKKAMYFEDVLINAVSYLLNVKYLSFPPQSKAVLCRRLFLLQRGIEAFVSTVPEDKIDGYRAIWKVFNSARKEMMA